MARRSIRRLTLAVLGVLLGTVDHASALGTAITYQGRLQQGGTPRTGPCDFQFSLFDAAAAGMQVGVTLGQNNLPVTTGLFTTQLDFGAAFTGSDRWLHIAVRCPAGSGTFTSLSPRQSLTAAPYAVCRVVVVFNEAISPASSATSPLTVLRRVPRT